MIQRRTAPSSPLFSPTPPHPTTHFTLLLSYTKPPLQARSLLAKLESKLHPLFSFSFVPKPPKRELAIRANVPAVALEDKTPTAVGSAHALAPQEVRHTAMYPAIN
jgi:hypothetical protein